MTRKALILGATGGIGGAVAKTLKTDGWQITAMARDLSQTTHLPQYSWVQGDAMNAGDVLRAAQNVDVIFHGVNPPGYRNWQTTVLPMIDNTIAAARATGARILLPGTIYNYDAATTPVISETTPQHTNSRKGQIRIALEQRLQEAAPEVPSLIVRSGDYFGPDLTSGWLIQGMTPKGRQTKRITRVAKSPGHSWAYVPDVAEAFARLLDCNLLPFEVVQFEGYYDESGEDMINALRDVMGNQKKVRRFPWPLVHLAAPFGGLMREVADIADLWKHPIRLDKSRLETLIGPEPHRPLAEAVAPSLK